MTTACTDRYFEASPPRARAAGVKFTPRSTWYHVRLSEASEASAGGIWLPASARQNWTEAKVMGAGPGMEIPTWGHPHRLKSVMWADPGETILFQRHHYRTLGDDHQEGLVRDEHLVAVIDSDGTLSPATDWVKIAQDEDVQAEGTVLYAEEWRPKPMHGQVADVGPGQVRLRGPFTGTRRPVEEETGTFLIGRRVWWDPSVEVLAVGRESLEWVLIRACDLMAVEEIE